MKPSEHDEALRWLAEAEEDIRVAELLAGAAHFSHACFHAQQAAEKAAKAFLYARGADDPWGHSITRLVEEAATFDDTLRTVYQAATVLDRFYVPTRYPNGLPGGLPSKSYHAEDARDALALAGTIIAAMRGRITS